MIYITGDKHGDFKQLAENLENIEITKDDTFIILGDSGLNYFAYKPTNQAKYYKRELNSMILKNKLIKTFRRCCGAIPTIFVLNGNHEARAKLISSYKRKEWNGGYVYYEEDFPEILFADEGNVYQIEGKSFLVIGGAYSVDKYYRLQIGERWFPEEQLSNKEKKAILDLVKNKRNVYDYVLSHTSPKKFIPTDALLSTIDQNTVDHSMEDFLDDVEQDIFWEEWFVGHFHIDKEITGFGYKKIHFLYEDIEVIE